LNKLQQIISLPYLLLKRDYYWSKIKDLHLPGRVFFHYGKSISRKLYQKGIVSPKLLLNPVSIVRYFEFDFALRNFEKDKKLNSNILDISSPYLFGFYISDNFEGEYKYINPDKNDLSLVKKYSSKIKFKMNYSAENADATNLIFPDQSFSQIFSISVIEHINDDGDKIAIKEMWRVLKQNGLLILTFPVAKLFKEEYSEKDTYGLNVSQKKDKFFFQRVYDEKSIQQRLLNNISDFTILSTEIFGEISEGFYDDYSKRWKLKGFRETVKDPYYIAKYFKSLESFSEIKDSAVIGITIRKDK